MITDFNCEDMKKVTVFGVTEILDMDEWAQFVEICKAFITLDNKAKTKDEEIKIISPEDLKNIAIIQPVKSHEITSEQIKEVPVDTKDLLIKDYTKYVKMHEDGQDVKTIRKTMLDDGFCKAGGLTWAIGQVLKLSKNVQNIVEPELTDEEKIERLKKKNAAITKEEKRQSFVRGCYEV